MLACARAMFLCALTFLRAIFCSKAVLAARLLAVKSQLTACKHKIALNKRHGHDSLQAFAYSGLCSQNRWTNGKILPI